MLKRTLDFSLKFRPYTVTETVGGLALVHCGSTRKRIGTTGVGDAAAITGGAGETVAAGEGLGLGAATGISGITAVSGKSTEFSETKM